MTKEGTYSTNRILKNTIYLYIRQIITLLVSLYTSRVVLDVLGIEDYGLYNVIAGFVVLLALINNSMVSATQRFLTYEIGKGDKTQVSNTFSMSMSIHILICVIIFILGETIGIYYIDNYLVVPDGRNVAAFWVYQLSLLSIFVNIIRSPYQASIIAYEHMNFYALISIVEVFLKLLIIYFLIFWDFDKLILYAVLSLAANIVVSFTYKFYCQNQFTTCRYYLYFDKLYIKKLAGFLGWNVVGAFSSLGTQQLGNIIINRFVGVAINAAYGTAIQISTAVSSFVTNFQTAFTPQIVKLYAQGDTKKMISLMNRSSLLSFYLLFIIVVPILFNINYVLSLWLKEVPPYTDIFCLWIFLTCFIDALQAPFWIAIGATGNIRGYQIWQSCLWFLSVPLLFICLNFGYEPYCVVVIRFVIAILGAIGRTIQVKFQIGISIIEYLMKVLYRIFIVSVVYIISAYYLLKQISNMNFITFIVFYVISFIFICCLVYTIGINKGERDFINNSIKSRFKLKIK